jgi:hypothetical protein
MKNQNRKDSVMISDQTGPNQRRGMNNQNRSPHQLPLPIPTIFEAAQVATSCVRHNVLFRSTLHNT